MRILLIYLLVFSPIFQNNFRPRTVEELRDQILINTARLDQLEAQMAQHQLEQRSDSDVWTQMVSDINLLKRQINDMVDLMKWLLGTTITTVIGTVSLFVRQSLSHRSVNRH